MKKIYYFLHNRIPNRLIYLISYIENFLGHLFPNLFIKLRFKFKYGVEKEIDIISILGNKKMNAIDVGANVGIYSFEFSKHFKYVYSYEPNLFIFKRLRKLKKKNILAFNFGLGDQNETQKLIFPKFIYGLGTFNKIPQKHKIRDYSTIESMIRKFDDFNIKDIGIIKIDTEGFELKVLKGMIQSIEKYRPNIIIEVDKVSLPKIRNQLEPLNYKFYIYKNKLVFNNANETSNIVALNRKIYCVNKHKIFDYLKLLQ